MTAKSFASAGLLSTNRALRRALVALQVDALVQNIQESLLDQETLEHYMIRRAAGDIASLNRPKEKQQNAFLWTIDSLEALADAAPKVTQ
jgi:hypothetical protein